MADNPRRAELLLVFVTLIWGTSFSITKEGLADASPLIFLGLRFLLAWIVLSAVGFRSFKHLNRRSIKDGLILGVLMFFGYAFQNLALVYTTAGRTGFIIYSFALYVPILQFLILKKKPHRGNLAGLGIVIIGMVLISNPLDGGSINPGDLLCLLSAVAYAFFIVFLDFMAKRSDPGILTNLQFLVIALLSFVLAPLIEDVYLRPTSQLFFGIAYLAVLGGVVAIYLMTRYQRAISPTKAVLIYALEPVFAVMVAVFIFHEGFSLREGAGCLAILGGVVLSELWKERRASNHSERIINS